jgi:hypothetical protein
MAINNHVNDANNTNATRRARVLRFEFSNEIIKQMAAFVQIHQYDDRKTYKAAWTEWLANHEIAAIFNAEVKRLTDLGYKGDVADKLYKSGRYYFRTREPTVQRSSLWPHTPPSGATSTPNDANGGRRGSGNQGSPRRYVLLSRELLSAMDDHIERGLRQQTEFTPAKGFAEFALGLDVASYRSEVARLSEIMPTGEAVGDKIKKTYKNRYFIIAKSAA